MRAIFSRIPSVLYLFSVPLLLFPLMINLRVFPFVAPNEEPKWGVLVLCGLLMAIAAGVLWWRRREPLQLRISVPAVLLSLFYLILATGIFIGTNKVEGSIRFTFWLAALAVWLTAAMATRLQIRWPAMLAWSLSIGSLVFSLRYWWSYVLDYGRPGYNVSVLFSPIGHVNFTGDVLVVLLPALIWLLAVRTEPIMKVINWFSVATILTVLLVASSRGALGGLVIGMLLLLPVLLKNGRQWLGSLRERRYRLSPVIWVGSALLASVIVYNMLPYHYRELARVSGTLQASFESGEVSKDAEQPPFASFWHTLSPLLGARTPMYASATAMALDAPFLGHGTGNFAWIYPGYSNRFPDFRDPLSNDRTFTTNPHNVVLQLATQNGFPAAILFLALLGLFLVRLLRSLWQQWDGWTATGVVAIAAALFDAMFNHVFFNPASMFVFALLGGSWWGYVVVKREGSDRAVTIASSFHRPAAVVLILSAVLLSIWPARWLVSEWYVGQAMRSMKLPARAAGYYEKAYSWNTYNFRVLFGMGQMAYQQKHYADAIRHLQTFETIYPYNPPALNMLGAAYIMSGQYQQAEAALQRAIKILPTFKMAKLNLSNIQAIMKQQQMPAQKPPGQP